MGVNQTVTGNFTGESVARISSLQNEPPWMLEKRIQAFQVFEQLPLPKTNSESWRRTDIRGLDLEQFQLVTSNKSQPNGKSPEFFSALEEGKRNSGLIIQKDAAVVYSALSDTLTDKGVYFAGFKAALDERPDLLKTYVCQTIQSEDNKFNAMHNAFLQSGYVLYIPKGVVVDLPLRVIVSLSGEAIADFSHTLVIAEADSQVTILEEHLSVDQQEKGLHCGGVEIFLGQNAFVNYAQIQNWNKKVWNFSTQRAKLERGANLRWITTSLGSRLSKLDQLVEMNGEGSHADLLGLTATHARQHIDIHTYQKHAVSNSTSNLLYRNVLKDRSRTVWRGMIEVQKDAQKIDSYQQNDNLILSKQARADTIPGLEILADDVRCTHGATAGKIDQDQIFYLMSRGLSYNQAEQVIVNGFFESVLQRIPLEYLRNKLQESIAGKLQLN